MTRFFRLLAISFTLLALVACEPGPNGVGTAPAGVSQATYENQVTARRQARSAYYRGPRGGHSGR